MQVDLAKLCPQVVELSRKAGAFIRKERQRFNTDAVELKGKNDLVSYVDKESEILLVKGLREILPEAGFITEEGTTGENPESYEQLEGYHWIIDPVDGTTNFVHSLPPYSVSIGLTWGRTPVLGVVYEVTADECFYAWKDGGAYCNGEPIRVAPVTDLAQSLIITGFPYRVFSDLGRLLDIIKHFTLHTHGVRRLGSAAADLAYVAAGRGEGFFEYNLKPWDVAGGVVLVQEAGGFISDFNGGDDYVFGRELVAAGPIHPQMQKVIAEYWNQTPTQP
ncbi:myo-inositol-1(or 4)-monophosphatase [Catalinimonas alkaloidigena]|uniref:Inositol-1-monophosphatase n=1 Tax=Catalinimonas alkaloidigena TaxID=1075417 RepID=A0A1G9ERF2_9BACT|nr:inositol monophosphatase family protein [Catalinimonas alkaloidigena]SDK78777.1 myo-inositol-1(or 4)-monophosphatase [Catalinimonas alkaloidigena]